MRVRSLVSKETHLVYARYHRVVRLMQQETNDSALMESTCFCVVYYSGSISGDSLEILTSQRQEEPDGYSECGIVRMKGS